MNKTRTEPLSIVVMGGSSGSFAIFEEILSMLHSPISFALIFVLHRGKSSLAFFPELFRKKTAIPMKEPEHLEVIVPNCIYFSFPDYHLLVGPDRRFYHDQFGQDHFSRPSIDATFFTLALSGIHVRAAMLFSGSSRDGALGLELLSGRGFDTFVQDPAFAEFPRMPQEALNQCNRHKVLKMNHFYQDIQDVLR